MVHQRIIKGDERKTLSNNKIKRQSLYICSVSRIWQVFLDLLLLLCEVSERVFTSSLANNSPIFRARLSETG